MYECKDCDQSIDIVACMAYTAFGLKGLGVQGLSFKVRVLVCKSDARAVAASYQ